MEGWNRDAELARWMVGASTHIHLVGGFVYKKRQMRVNNQIAFRDYSFKTTNLVEWTLLKSIIFATERAVLQRN